MDKEAWFTSVKDNKKVLLEITKRFHPSCKTETLPITAKKAEKACEVVRARIKRQDDRDPVEVLTFAIEHKDSSTILRLLNDVWFGVPESTHCWKVPGFKELVDLIEDFPDE